MPFEYHNDPEKTEGGQTPRTTRWARLLGDVGYVDDDGYLFLTDRKAFMIISGGVNIYPQEIEDIMVMHPKVFDVAVFGVPNPDTGEEVKAVVQLAPGAEATDATRTELLAHAREHLAVTRCRAASTSRTSFQARDRQALQAAAQGPLLGQPRHPHRLTP